MKKTKLITIAALVGFGLAGCATTVDNTKSDNEMMKSEATTTKVATCKEGDPGYPKCETGGGLGGPILGNRTSTTTEVATCNEGDPGYPKCVTGGGLGGPILDN